MHQALPTAPRAVFFDFDGVLADTENVHVAAWQRTLAGLGWALSDEVAARAVEVDDRVFLSELFKQRGIEGGDVDGWILRKQQLTISLLQDSPRLYPGVKALVERLAGRVRLAVVSTTWRANINAILKSADLTGAFDTIVGKEDVQAVKPDPEGYRLALQRVDVKASEAVAIEDSKTGLTAARGASIHTLAVGHRLPLGEWVGESLFVENLVNTSETLAKLGLD